ncbi:MAG: hypothetical protein RL211_1375 [Pseudomonadota bacterium]|jgi:hypothetical protein
MFNRGLNNGSYIADGISRAMDGIVEKARADANLSRVRRLVEERDEARTINASNYCEKHALRSALAKLDPTHPLLTNKALQEKIRETGARIWVLSNEDGESVAKAGRDFNY